MRRRRECLHRWLGSWRLGLALGGLLLAWALPASAENGLDVGPVRSIRVDGRPDRFVVCDQAGHAPVVSVMLGRRAVAVARALGGETVVLDPGACEPPLSARPSVQCSVGRAPQLMHIDVRLADRARRAGTGIFGERWEYRSLRLRQLSGDNVVSWVDHEVELPLDEVFEDRVVRHVDQPSTPADSCGVGFLVIRSHARQGAALALYALSSSGLESRAVSEPLGTRESWRDVIGIADVVGDGRRRVVEVTEPHRAGRLQIDDIRAGRIEPESTLDGGYTTHRFGTARQGIGALLDLTGDGVADIVVPTSDWKCLAVVTARHGVLREVGRLSCGSALIVDVLAADLNGDNRDDLVAVRADGTIEAWFR